MVDVGMLPEAPVVPNLQTRAVLAWPGESPMAISQQDRHSQNASTGFVDSPDSSGRIRAR